MTPIMDDMVSANATALLKSSGSDTIFPKAVAAASAIEPEGDTTTTASDLPKERE